MNKRIQRKLDVFKRVQAAKPQYSFSQYSLHDQAIREHITRGFGGGLTRQAGLLDQRNKI